MTIGSVEHLGETVRPGKYGYRLTRELYALPNKKPSVGARREDVSEEQWAASAWAFEDEAHTSYTDEVCDRQRSRALGNFDLNMQFFAGIDANAFEASLTQMLGIRKSMRQVTDLQKWDGVEGVYVMVLDAYKQAYVGASTDVRKRVRSHWTGTKQFDRLLWGSVDESILSIDSFRALDTTRLYAARTTTTYSLEVKLEQALPRDYLLNRIGGGEMTDLRLRFAGLEMRQRDLRSMP